MRPESFISLADSKDVALVLSLLANFVLAWALKQVYQAKEKLHNQLTELLRTLVPYTLGIKNHGKN